MFSSEKFKEILGQVWEFLYGNELKRAIDTLIQAIKELIASSPEMRELRKSRTELAIYSSRLVRIEKEYEEGDIDFDKMDQWKSKLIHSISGFIEYLEKVDIPLEEASKSKSGKFNFEKVEPRKYDDEGDGWPDKEEVEDVPRRSKFNFDKGSGSVTHDQAGGREDYLTQKNLKDHLSDLLSILEEQVPT